MKTTEKNERDFLEKYGRLFAALKTISRESCPEAETLYRYFTHELADTEKQTLEQHLDLCPSCLGALMRLEQIQEREEKARLPENWHEIEKEMDGRIYAYLRSASVDETSPVLTSKSRDKVFSKFISSLQVLLPQFGPKQLAYAGVALCLFVGMIYGYAFLNRPPYFTAAQIRPEKPATTRGEGTSAIDLQQGLEFFELGRYELAIEKLQSFLESSPNHYLANFHLGLLYLVEAKVSLLGLQYGFDGKKVAHGVEHLERALTLAGQNEFYQEDCLWYLGKAALMKGDVEKAKLCFNRLLSLKSPNLMRKDDARELLKRLNENI